MTICADCAANILLSQSEEERQLSIDVRRSILLGSYIQHWGMPSFRTLCHHKDQLSAVEVYMFPPWKDDIYRFATVAVSSQLKQNGQLANWELLLCLPEDLGGADNDKVKNYLLDIMTYSLRDDVFIREGTTIPESVLAPEEWTTKALLFDEARGESEELSHFHIGQQKVDLLWLVPLTGNEYKFIKTHGLEGFDEIVQASGWSILDVNRDSMV